MPHVDLLVSDELLDQLPKVLRLLQATEVARRPNDAYTTTVTLDMPYAPDGAHTVDPVFASTPSGVRLQSLAWTFPGQEDDPPVQCWHTEADTPCD